MERNGTGLGTAGHWTGHGIRHRLGPSGITVWTKGKEVGIDKEVKEYSALHRHACASTSVFCSTTEYRNDRFDADQVDNGKCPVMPSQPKLAHRLPTCLM